MKVCYLASKDTLPNSPHRRSDAFEHDQMIEAFHVPFKEGGLELTSVSWDDPKEDWSKYDAVVIGTTWDYVGREDEFLKRLKEIETKTKLFNPSQLVEWNVSKTYLKDLENKGAKIIPTVWLGKPKESEIQNIFEKFDCDELVLKPQVGASGIGQYRLKRGETIPDLHEPMMAQPFFPNIITEGELSFIFIDGKSSHTLLKTAATGEYRIQSMYGGVEQSIVAKEKDLKDANGVIDLLDDVPLYARVDMVRGKSGDLYLMELELIEPFLYPLQGPGLGTLVAEALKKRISAD